MRYFIHTTGCKANQWDSRIMKAALEAAGHLPGTLSDADMVIINACTLTDGAEKDIRRFLNRARRENNNAQTVIAGCHGQANGARDFGADTILGHREKFEIDRYIGLHGTFVSKGREFPIEEVNLGSPDLSRTRFFFKIQDGCDRFCSYCIVPYARGSARSRPLKEILRVMGYLRNEGLKEVVITGIEIASYRDPASSIDLKGLLRVLEKADTPDRIRMSSIDPGFIDREFIEILSNSEKLSKSLHVSLQSGSPSVLERMRRKYELQKVKESITGLIEKVPSIGIGMDIITGFPGEDDKAFEETYHFLEGLPIFYLHVFPFSSRPGTNACNLDSKVPAKTKKARVDRLRKLAEIKREAFCGRFIGSEITIIPEGKVYRGSFLRGYGDNYLPVYIPFQKGVENHFVEVRIKGILSGIPEGEVIRVRA